MYIPVKVYKLFLTSFEVFIKAVKKYVSAITGSLSVQNISRDKFKCLVIVFLKFFINFL